MHNYKNRLNKNNGSQKPFLISIKNSIIECDNLLTEKSQSEKLNNDKNIK